MSDADCTPGRKPRIVAASFLFHRCTTVTVVHYAAACLYAMVPVTVSLAIIYIAWQLVSCGILYWTLITSPVWEQLQSILMSISVCLAVCLSVHEDISGITRALFTEFFVHVAYERGSVLLWHVDDRPHHLSLERRWWECTARAKCNLRLPCFVLETVDSLLNFTLCAKYIHVTDKWLLHCLRLCTSCGRALYYNNKLSLYHLPFYLSMMGLAGDEKFFMVVL